MLKSCSSFCRCEAVVVVGKAVVAVDDEAVVVNKIVAVDDKVGIAVVVI